jgi:single-stranded DNA-specific DHH superfamily exonuclease
VQCRNEKEVLLVKLDDLKKSVVLQEDIPEPPIADLLNADLGIKLLLYHMNNGGVIGIHFDVDLDGFSSGIVAYRALKAIMPTKVHITTNKERIHGVTKDTEEFVWNNRISLLIIVDAGSDLNYDVGCDVLVLDHHELSGTTVRKVGDNRQVVVSNQGVPNQEPMSGCEVVYEFFRRLYAQMETPIDTSLAQWVGISLISDIIDTKTLRNQFYVRQAFEANVRINADIRRICTDIDYYFKGLYRSYVTYKLAPYINAISRAGLSSTLSYVISDNESPRLPDWALKRRDDICTEAFIRSKRVGNLVFCNMTGVEDAWRYAGLAASKIANETNFPTIVFTQSESGLVSGSFRKGIGEGEFLETAKKYLNANGHNPAFGFKNSAKEGLKNFIAEISAWEVGEPPEQLTSDDIKGGVDLQIVGIWNNRVNPSDEIYIKVRPEELVYERSTGQVSHYKWRERFPVKLLYSEFPQPPRLFVEEQRGISLYLK